MPIVPGESQGPFFPGYPRGLVAVLLYYDGRVSLVNALRALIQSRPGRTWSLDLPEDLVAITTRFTDQIMADGLVNKILGLLRRTDLASETDRLQKPEFRALGTGKLRKQVIFVSYFMWTECLMAKHLAHWSGRYHIIKPSCYGLRNY